MALPVAPQSVTIYDVVKDLGFPVVVALILLFQIVPKLDDLTATNSRVESQVTTLAQLCVARTS